MISDEIFNVIKIDKAFTKADCNAILDIAGANEFEVGQVASGGGVFTNNRYRKSALSLLEKEDDTEWIYKRMQHFVIEANKIFKFDLQGMEMLQVAEYNSGEYYREHMDLGGGQTRFRKLSVVVQLSDPNDYTGGILRCNQPEATCGTEQGSMLIFPSFVTHQVSNIESGTRYSLAGWFTGSRFV
jgi:PKHD-type hydroxylase